MAENIKQNFSDKVNISINEDIIDKRDYNVSFSKYNNLLNDKNYQYKTIYDAIEEFKEYFSIKKINYNNEIYNNKMMTEKLLKRNSEYSNFGL